MSSVWLFVLFLPGLQVLKIYLNLWIIYISLDLGSSHFTLPEHNSVVCLKTWVQEILLTISIFIIPFYIGFVGDTMLRTGFDRGIANFRIWYGVYKESFIFPHYYGFLLAPLIQSNQKLCRTWKLRVKYKTDQPRWGWLFLMRKLRDRVKQIHPESSSQ